MVFLCRTANAFDLLAQVTSRAVIGGTNLIHLPAQIAHHSCDGLIPTRGLPSCTSRVLWHRSRAACEARDPAANLVAGRLKAGLKRAPSLLEPCLGLINVHEPKHVHSARQPESKSSRTSKCHNPQTPHTKLQSPTGKKTNACLGLER